MKIVMLFLLSLASTGNATTAIYVRCTPKDLLALENRVNIDGQILVDENQLKASMKSPALAKLRIDTQAQRSQINLSGKIRIENIKDLRTLRFIGTTQNERLSGIRVLLADGQNYLARLSSGKAPLFNQTFSGDMNCKFSMTPFPRDHNGHFNSILSATAFAKNSRRGSCTLEELNKGYKNVGRWVGHPHAGKDYVIYCVAPENNESDVITGVKCIADTPSHGSQTCCRYMYGVKDECWVEAM